MLKIVLFCMLSVIVYSHLLLIVSLNKKKTIATLTIVVLFKFQQEGLCKIVVYMYVSYLDLVQTLLIPSKSTGKSLQNKKSM